MKIDTKSRNHLDALLRRACAAPRHNERNYRVSEYLDSQEAKLLAILAAYEAMRPDHCPDKAKLQSIASSLDPWLQRWTRPPHH